MNNAERFINIIVQGIGENGINYDIYPSRQYIGKVFDIITVFIEYPIYNKNEIIVNAIIKNKENARQLRIVHNKYSETEYEAALLSMYETNLENVIEKSVRNNTFDSIVGELELMHLKDEILFQCGDLKKLYLEIKLYKNYLTDEMIKIQESLLHEKKSNIRYIDRITGNMEVITTNNYCIKKDLLKIHPIKMSGNTENFFMLETKNNNSGMCYSANKGVQSKNSQFGSIGKNRDKHKKRI